MYYELDDCRDLATGDDKYRDAVQETVVRLCERQSDEGYLSALPNSAKGDVLTTLLMFESVQRSGLASKLSHVIERGEQWIMESQKPVGPWCSDGWPDEIVTAAVLDYFAHHAEMLPQVDVYFLMARDFYKKAIELKVEDGANNRRLATIAAVHAVEMFLYGFFDRRDDLGISAYKENGTETVGPRAALRVLQETLQVEGLLGANKNLQHRDQLRQLIRKRDNVIHHASEITCEELSHGLLAVQNFVSKYGIDIPTGLFASLIF